MTPEMQQISSIIQAGAPMNLPQIIQNEINLWKSSHALRLMLKGEFYYIADQDILERKRQYVGPDGSLMDERNLANHRLVHAFIRKLVDQKIGYLLSKPMTVKVNNDAYGEQLKMVFNNKFQRKLKNIGKDAINKGRAWLQVYYDEAGNLSFKRIPTEEIIPLWKDAEHTELDAAIRVYDVETYEGNAMMITTKVEYWDKNGVQRYVYSKNTYGSGVTSGLIPDYEVGQFGSHFVGFDDDGNEQGYNWDRVPLVCFKYNDEEQPLIKFVKSLIDDYDLQRSDNSNNLTDLPNGIYVLKEYGDEDLGKFRRNLSQYRAVKVNGEGGVDTLNLELNPEAMKYHNDQLRKDIYEMGRGVDLQTESFKGATGVALKALYNDLDMDANNIETEFQASLEQLLWFINTHFANVGAGDFTKEDAEFIFDRNILINETDTITNAKNSVGLISDETIIANHPWVTDPVAELERVKQERAEGMNDPYAELLQPKGAAPPNQGGGTA